MDAFNLNQQGRKHLLIGVASLACFVFVGCTFLNGISWGARSVTQAWTHPLPSTSPVVLTSSNQKACSVDHRFEPTELYPANLRADLALDSCTGKICKTWSWQAVSKENASAVYDGAPLCEALRTKYP